MNVKRNLNMKRNEQIKWMKNLIKEKQRELNKKELPNHKTLMCTVLGISR